MAYNFAEAFAPPQTICAQCAETLVMAAGARYHEENPEIEGDIQIKINVGASRYAMSPNGKAKASAANTGRATRRRARGPAASETFDRWI